MRLLCGPAVDATNSPAIVTKRRVSGPGSGRHLAMKSLELDHELVAHGGPCRGAVPTIDGRVMALGDAQLVRKSRWVADHGDLCPEDLKVLDLSREPITRRF